jgi:hypothetical protein
MGLDRTELNYSLHNEETCHDKVRRRTLCSKKVLPKNRGEGILSEVGYTTSKYGSHSI